MLYVSLVLLTQCSHSKQSDPSPVSQLPPATQTGANTFGCLVNGRAYVPGGNNGTANFALLYEPATSTYQFSQFNAYTYNITASRKYINLYCGPITASQRIFSISLDINSMLPLGGAVGCYDGPEGDFCNDKGLKYRHGQLVITRLDEQAGVIAGTFEFTSVTTKGDTLKVTQGRFDSKL